MELHHTPKNTDEVVKFIYLHGHTELKEQVFAFISPSKLEFFEQDTLFGENVNKEFPDAVLEIKAFGNCMAADLHTAAVFHLTRAAEVALIELTERLKIKRSKSGLTVNIAGWGDIIGAIDVFLDEKIQSLKGKGSGKRTSKKLSELVYYQTISKELGAIKDLWRDPVSHGRTEYNQRQALDAFEHIKEFMMRLASRNTKPA